MSRVLEDLQSGTRNAACYLFTIRHWSDIIMTPDDDESGNLTIVRCPCFKRLGIIPYPDIFEVLTHIKARHIYTESCILRR